MIYSSSRDLYVDFLLERLSREDFLHEVIKLSEKERNKLFTFSKMHIFKPLVEKMTKLQGT